MLWVSRGLVALAPWSWPSGRHGAIPPTSRAVLGQHAQGWPKCITALADRHAGARPRHASEAVPAYPESYAVA